MNRMLDWRDRLAGDRRVVALGEDERKERDGELWIVAHCHSSCAADRLFDHLWDQGWRTLGRRSANSIWLERADDDESLTF
jgi:mannose-6-phosphate isomerase class I